MRKSESAQLSLRAASLLVLSLASIGLFSVVAQADEELSTPLRRRHPNHCSFKDGNMVCPEPSFDQKMAYKEGDQAEDILDDPTTLVRNLREMDQSIPRRAEVAKKPWSGYYWPNYKGLVANRYADPNFFSGGTNWSRYRAYAQRWSALKIWRSGNQAQIDRLSPAEKYDILMGDENFTFTRSMWKVGENDIRNYGRVETWTGICDGNAASTLSHDRPEHAIRLLSADRRTWVNFYPMDIKGLTSILWSRNMYPANQVGNRCNERFPVRNGSGHVNDDACFNTNPGTWHMATVNRIGKDQRGFVMDLSWAYEVWNHVVLAYDYSYFNVRTLKATKNLEDAMVPVRQLAGRDRFARYRSPRTAYIVGVNMKAYYSTGITPRQRNVDPPSLDGRNSMKLSYDLELDVNGDIVGGEWRTTNHPDFIWAPVKDHRVRTVGDEMAVTDYTGDTAVPADWAAGARASSAKGSPLGKVIDVLIEHSRR